ncbi:DeoR/GlpR family DNA-binding transcription regulator [Bacillus sp. Marseille-Q1617]|uniref:DeoR/GlpR family DNA-binding transcription regulator n=1 Tax=Bacillus sp. Marseille-Q1617 TaxID=2736887 RepID=UPI00158DBF95|nr:DeoR/GlpR family DNA-binding transcription regulator [Bacillus sp. Marseille-Q1617]
MFSEERREKILEKVEKIGRVLAKDLAEEYNVSIDSIRRDLSIMEEDGLLKRTHGGAIPNPKARNKPQAPSIRYGEGNPAQNAIAKAAAEYIKEDETVFIGGSSIHYLMLKYIPRTIVFTVVTNSVEIAYHLRDFSNVETYLIGGKMKESGNITDGLANEFAKQFTIDVNFVTAGGLSTRGLSTSTPEVAIFHNTILTNSRKNIVLMENHKLGMDMFAVMKSPMSKLALVITDDETGEEKIGMIHSHGVNTRIVETE